MAQVLDRPRRLKPRRHRRPVLAAGDVVAERVAELPADDGVEGVLGRQVLERPAEAVGEAGFAERDEYVQPRQQAVAGLDHLEPVALQPQPRLGEVGPKAQAEGDVRRQVVQRLRLDRGVAREAQRAVERAVRAGGVEQAEQAVLLRLELGPRVDQALLPQRDLRLGRRRLGPRVDADLDALPHVFQLPLGQFERALEDAYLFDRERIIPVRRLDLGEERLDVAAQFVAADLRVEPRLPHVGEVHARAEAAEQGLRDGDADLRLLLFGRARGGVAALQGAQLDVRAGRQPLANAGDGVDSLGVDGELPAGAAVDLARPVAAVLDFGEQFRVEHALLDQLEAAGDDRAELLDAELAVARQGERRRLFDGKFDWLIADRRQVGQVVERGRRRGGERRRFTLDFAQFVVPVDGEQRRALGRKAAGEADQTYERDQSYHEALSAGAKAAGRPPLSRWTSV